MNNPRNRGVEDILIAVVDGLKCFPGAINTAFPDTTVQTCIVNLVRHSLNFCGWKDRKNVAKDQKRVYKATDDADGKKALADFEVEWSQKYPSIAPSWRRAWQEFILFFAFPPAVRKIIYTTNAIESLNSVIRKTTKTRDKANLSGHRQLREDWQGRQTMGCRAKPVRYPRPETGQ
jgi:putative transposase